MKDRRMTTRLKLNERNEGKTDERIIETERERKKQTERNQWKK